MHALVVNDFMEILALYQFDLVNRAEVGLNYFVEQFDYLSGVTSPNVPLNPRAYKWMLKSIFIFI